MHEATKAKKEKTENIIHHSGFTPNQPGFVAVLVILKDQASFHSTELLLS